MDHKMTFVSATFFTIVGLLVLSTDIEVNYIAVGVVLLTVAVIQWYNFLSESRRMHAEQKRAEAWWAEEKKEQQLFDQEATQSYNITPDTDWTK